MIISFSFIAFFFAFSANSLVLTNSLDERKTSTSFFFFEKKVKMYTAYSTILSYLNTTSAIIYLFTSSVFVCCIYGEILKKQ